MSVGKKLFILLCLGIGSIQLGCNSRSMHFHESESLNFSRDVCARQQLKKLDLGIKGYAVYPPLSALPQKRTRLDSIPDCIVSLTKLKEINLSGVGLKKINPKLFDLHKLEYLDVSFNPDLDIHPYLAKFASLPNLRVLGIAGLKIDSLRLETFKKAHPDVEVRSDDFFQDQFLQSRK